jgi:2-polyprenyl-3-methyl-5-hydroxy-6-metoxy-1,4-benzoquinol methylase
MPAAPSDRDPRVFFYESFADQWDARMDRNEIDKRLRLVFSRFLRREEVRGKRVLDAGAGMGYFSRTLADWGAHLVAMDMGPALLSKVREKCAAEAVVGSALELPFSDKSFDVVLCTEVIEHTRDPRRAVAELCRVSAPGCLLLLTTPNRLWRPAVVVANALRLRPYQGYENWVGYRELAAWVGAAGLRVEHQSGFNLMPHTFFCRPTFDFLDRIGSLHPFMINIALRARRPG